MSTSNNCSEDELERELAAGTKTPTEKEASFLEQAERTPEIIWLIALLNVVADVAGTDELVQAILEYIKALHEPHVNNLRLDQQIAILERGIRNVPDEHELKPKLLSNLYNMLWSRFQSRCDIQDLHEAINYCTKAVSLTGNQSSQMPGRLNDLCVGYMLRFQQLGDLQDVEKAIECGERAVQLTPEGDPDKSMYLGNLGSAHDARFQRLGHSADINKAMHCATEALSLTPIGHSGQAKFLDNLGNLYSSRFKRCGDFTDLDMAMNCYSQAVQLTLEADQNRSRRMSNLARAFADRFDCYNRLGDIDESIQCYIQALNSLVEERPMETIQIVSNLGTSYRLRFERLGELADLDRAVHCHEQVVSHTVDNHTDKSGRLNNLGNSYESRFHRLGRIADIEQAVDCYRQAVRLAPDSHADKPGFLSNLGISYCTRFERLGAPTDLDQAIECQNRSIALVSDTDASKPTWLNNLANSYQRRFRFLHQAADIDQTIIIRSQVLELISELHTSWPQWLSSLGSAYADRFRLSHNSSDMEGSISCYRGASTSAKGSPLVKFESSRTWAVLCLLYDRSSLLEAYEYVMALVPQVAWIGAALHRQYESIVSDIRDVVARAASAAILQRRFDLALEWFEGGRSIVWSHMSQLRTSFDDLGAVDSELATLMANVANKLDQANPLQINKPAETALNAPSLETVSRTRRVLAVQWDELLERARSLDGFQNFLKPLRFSELPYESISSTLIVINVYGDTSDAIVIPIGSKSPMLVHLHDFSSAKAVHAQSQLLGSLHKAHIRSRDTRKPVFYPDGDHDQIQIILATLWTDVVKPILRELGYLQNPPPKQNLPRVTWCANGPLASLPLHAAGCYDEPDPRTFNYVVSSYTPSISVLEKSTRPSPSTSFHGILAVGQVLASSNAPLPGTAIELNLIEDRSQHIPFKRLDGSQATPFTVLGEMEHFSWVHMACHGSQSAGDPTSSAFQLHGGELSLTAITKKRLAHAEFAFLSACQTATGDERLPDEAIHLAAGMIMVGFRSVVATMWSIEDHDAPLVAARVYEQLLEGGRPNSLKSAGALQAAVGHLREQIGEKEFWRWVPYVHFGH
ncbi:hypothetical protein FRC08_000520 [Ceratobasidium sp. 394]|nr:hypothetical protein FRC08_000520 [Ceratobasidium sp. 394]